MTKKRNSPTNSSDFLQHRITKNLPKGLGADTWSQTEEQTPTVHKGFCFHLFK